jgi:transposase InsO family protein
VGEIISESWAASSRNPQVGHRITGGYPGAVNRHHGIGWEFVHVCIDDASRVAFVQVMANQRKESAVAFLEAAVAYFAKLGIGIERVMTDNGSCYRSKTTYARAYQNSDQRSAELLSWLHRYNWHRPHGSLKANTPISCLGLTEDNQLRLHS